MMGMFWKLSTSIVFIEGTLIRKQSIKILTNNMLPSAQKLMEDEFIFQEDNDPKHGGERCRIVKEFTKERKINRLDWPPSHRT